MFPALNFRAIGLPAKRSSRLTPPQTHLFLEPANLVPTSAAKRERDQLLFAAACSITETTHASVLGLSCEPSRG